MSTSTEVRELTYAQAINEALTEEFERDERVILIGEDVGRAGGVYKISEGLYDRFGPERVIDSPISEAGITGVALGAAMTGLRPVVELMFGDFTTLAMDQIVNQAAKIRYMSGGALAAPLVVRTTMGAGRSLGAQHSQSLHAWFAHIPGLKVVMPGSPEDAKGLLKAAIRSDDPVVYFEDKAVYRERGLVPTGDVVTPMGVARVCREGTDITLVAVSSMVAVALAAAHELEAHGISAEVVDPRSLTPLDEGTLLASVVKTSRCIVIDEGHGRYGASAELAAVIAGGAFFSLNAPVERIAASDVPIPFNPRLEAATVPDAGRVVASVRAMLAR
jgi:pyruvate/2-oxoglutarate/acetoin dehydrogenase E1 component